MNIRNLLVVFAVSTLALFANAGDIKPYTQQEFDSLAQKGKSVIVHVTAPWCPTCKAQKPIVDSLSKQPNYSTVTILTVDFDSEKNILKQYKVNMQSTLIAFSGGKETSRSVGDTSPEGIEGIFKKTVN
jgi:thiol-disulfide isomerase/thioredoxin